MGATEKFSDLTVKRLSKPGVYGDGRGLYIRVTDTGSKHWIHRFTLRGKAHWMGLGPYPEITLSEARLKNLEARRIRLTGVNPINARNAANAKALSMTFQECADQYIASHRKGWKSSRYVDKWTNTIATYCGPVMGKLPVNEIDVALVMRVLDPIWSTKVATASNLRGRIESVLDWAAVQGYREGDNPARWRGHLENLLAKPSKIKKTTHHAALGYTQMGELMAKLREQDGNAARALEFAILTACRSGEVRFAVWEEINLKHRIWIIPGERMKAGKEHRIPLSDAAMAVLDQMDKETALIFPGRRGTRVSDMSLTKAIRRAGYDNVTVHGFRSTFQDWAADCTAYPQYVADMALAHSIKDKVEAAYRRGDLFAKRTRMMEDWANFCNQTQSGDVVPLRKSNTVT